MHVSGVCSLCEARNAHVALQVQITYVPQLMRSMELVTHTAQSLEHSSLHLCRHVALPAQGRPNTLPEDYAHAFREAYPDVKARASLECA